MTDFEAEIMAKEQEIDRVRAGTLPTLEDAVLTAFAAWAADLWEDVIRNEIQRRPDAAKANSDKLPQLKAALADLRANVDQHASDHLSPLFLHHDAEPGDLASWCKDDRGWAGSGVYVSPPWNHSKRADDPIRCLAGLIGIAMADAGLVDDGTPVMADGRFRYAMPLSPGSPASAALAEYRRVLAELAVMEFELEQLRTAKAQSEASDLWDNA